MPGQKRGGRLPNSRLIEVTALYDSQGRYVSKDAFLQLTRGLSESPVAYCVGGVRSALFSVLFEAYLGKPARNYDGSLWEWSAIKDLPLISDL